MPLDAADCATRGHFGSIAQPVGRAVLALHGEPLRAFRWLFAVDTHAEAHQAVAAPAHQAGVVLEASGSIFFTPFLRGDTDLRTSLQDAWPGAAELDDCCCWASVRSCPMVPDRSPASLLESLSIHRLWNEPRTLGSHDFAEWLEVFRIIEFEVVAIPRPPFCAVAPAERESAVGKLAACRGQPRGCTF